MALALLWPGTAAAAQPTCGQDRYVTAEDTELVVPAPGVLANDSDPDGDELTAILVYGAVIGSVALNPDGSFTYTPPLNYHGIASFSYTATDPDGNLCLVVNVGLDISPVNDAPEALDLSYDVNENSTLREWLRGTDIDADPLRYVLVSGPAHGTVTGTDFQYGIFEYTPDLGFTGSDSFTYKANDGQADSNVATVTLTVHPFDNPPVAREDSYTAVAGTPLVVSAPGVLANDTDVDGDPITAQLYVDDDGNVYGPVYGELALNPDGSFTYTPTPSTGFTGLDRFWYSAHDGGQPSLEPAPVWINVVSNAPPVASNGNSATDEDTAVGVTLVATDAEGDALTYSVVSGPAHGALSGVAPSLTYTPDPDFHGDDSFTFRANDGQADSNVATVAIAVAPVNDPPVADAGADQAAAEGLIVAFDGSASLDPDGDSLSYAWDPDYDGTTFEPDPSLTGPTPGFAYADDGAYTVALRVTDAQGAASELATTQVTVADVPPALTPPANQAADEGAATAIDLGSFADPGADGPWTVGIDWGDGTSESIAAAAPGALGTLEHLYADGPATRTVTVTITDADGVAGGSVTFGVRVTNVAPAVGPAALASGDRAGRTTMTATFSDPAGALDGPFTAVVDWGDGSPPSTAHVDEATGTVTSAHAYKPGTYTIVVTVTDKDGEAGSSATTVTVGRQR